MINNKGFIQIPFLLLIITSIAIISGGGYFVAQKKHSSLNPQTESTILITNNPADNPQPVNADANIQTEQKDATNKTNNQSPSQTLKNKEAVIQTKQEISTTEQTSSNILPSTQNNQPTQNQTIISQPYIAPSQPTTTSTTSTQTPTIATPPITTSQSQTQPIKISISIDSKSIGETTAKIEWSTSESTESKLYLTGENKNSEQYLSESGFSTKHIVQFSNLKPITDYSYQITAIGNNGFTDYTDTFKTKTPSPTLKVIASSNIPLNSTGNEIRWNTIYVSSCVASGDWSGNKDTSGKYSLFFTQTGNYTYNLICTGNNGEIISKIINITVFDSTPKITFFFNGNASNTYTGYIGESVKMEWKVNRVAICTASSYSNNWNWQKSSNNLQTIALDSVGTFNYTLECISTDTSEKGSATASITVIP